MWEAQGLHRAPYPLGYGGFQNYLSFINEIDIPSCNNWIFISIIILQAIAEETKSIVQKEEAGATIKARETQAIADDAQRDLNEALPALVSVYHDP